MKKRLLFVFFDFILLSIVFLLYFLFVYSRAEQIVKEKTLNNFRSNMVLKAYLIDNNISRYIEGAKSISSRSMIRNKIIDYKKGKITFKELKDYTKTNYIEGLKALDNCVSAIRIVDDSVLVNWSFPQEDLNTLLPGNSPRKITTKIVFGDTIFNVLVISPVKKNDDIYAYDLILSRCSSLVKAIEDSSETLSIFKKKEETEFKTNFCNHFELQRKDTILFCNDSVYFITPSKFTNATYSFSKKESEVFSDLNNFRFRQLITMILIVVVFALLLFIIQKQIQLNFIKKSFVLQNMVTEKTENLNCVINELEQTNKKLKERENELLSESRTKDKFFSIIAHDLSNPLNSTTELTKILYYRYNDFHPDKRREIIKSVNEGLQNTQKLLENLLMWSRIQRDAIPFSPKQIELFKLVNNTLKLFKITSQNKNQTIINLIPKETLVYADEYMLKTIFRNLISNAIKFTNRNGLIEIGINISEKQKIFDEIFIKDNGTGMNVIVLKNLFNINKTISKPGTNDEKGTGLGLVLCKEFIEKHEGKIIVKSKENKGSKFIISLKKVPEEISKRQEN